ncbi:HlyD family type I secretion periplasmic adaptor subunit [Duganella sp. Dugasp56]|uniref:HlyD family type I secretion periplasmic adaptor subunit n=1 Tax=Duganella sp. Dugasp56 TaxID=3243046 RepID=UPI0039B02D71
MAIIVKKNSEPATEVISHDVTPLTVNTDAGAYARVGWFIVVFGVLAFLVWAAFAPLDKGVPMSGTVAKEGNRKAIQYQTVGIIQDILVHDGDVVKAGQVLVRMNSIQAKSALDTSKAQYFTSRSMEARLLTELKGGKSVPFPPTLEQYKNDPRVDATLALQRQLFDTRQMAMSSELSAIDLGSAGLRAQLQGLTESVASKKEQVVILKEQLDNLRDLAKDGYVARSRLLDQERAYVQLTGSISEDIGNIGRVRSQIAETAMRRTLRMQEYQKEVRSQLSDSQREAEALQSRIDAQAFELETVEIKSPVDGTVVGSAVFTKGGVVGAGAHLMEIVPADDALVVEGNLPVNLIDKVHPGLPVELIFSAFNVNSTPHIPGELTTVAADRMIDEKTGVPYYKVRVKVTKEGAKIIAAKKLHIIAGMPVELFVKTGERTMMNYLLKPVFDRSKSSMTEE